MVQFIRDMPKEIVEVPMLPKLVQSLKDRTVSISKSGTRLMLFFDNPILSLDVIREMESFAGFYSHRGRDRSR